MGEFVATVFSGSRGKKRERIDALFFIHALDRRWSILERTKVI